MKLGLKMRAREREPGSPNTRDGTFDKKIIWAIMNEKAHLFSPVFGVRAEGNTNKANGPLGSHRTAQNSVLGHSRVP